ncbi:MAG: hypothetical protein GY939_02690 [Actinomycetia bacterium]|nr:hypothetical protein [Actinomycetes bacterium]
MADHDGPATFDGEGSLRVLLEDVRTKPARNVVFAAAADDPRARRPADLMRLVVSAAILLYAAGAFEGGNDLDTRVAGAFSEGLPSWISAPLTIVFILGGLYSAVLLVAILVFGSGRAAVARDMFLAGILAAGLAIGASLVVGSGWPDMLPEMLGWEGVPSYPVLRLALATALIRVAHPYLTVSMRHVGGRLLGGMVIASLLLGYGTVTSIIGGIALGVGSAAAVHLVFGSGLGIPSLVRIGHDLATIGIEIISVEYLAQQPIGATLVRAETTSGDVVLVKIYGRDALDTAIVARAWRALWYRDSHRAISATGLQQVEHESLMLLEGKRAAGAVPELMAWGPSDSGDALVAVKRLEGEQLATLAGDRIDGSTLVQCWHALLSLHDGGIAHRNIDTRRIIVTDDGMVLGDLSSAAMSSDPLMRATDLAQMLVATAVVGGLENAIDAARQVIGDDGLLAALPLVQASALPATLQSDVKASELKLKDVRAAISEAVGTEPPPLAQLARVTWGNVIMVTLTLIAASALISSFADIGFDTIADEVADASWAWIIAALVLAQLTNVGEWISLTGLVPLVPFGPTFRFRYAIAFISLAVPSEAGAITMNIRYMQKQGVPWAAAVAQGPLLTIFSKGFDIILLILSARIIGETVELDDVDSGPVLRIIILVVVLAILGVIVTLVVPKLRNMVIPPIKEGFAAVRESVTDPDRLLRIASGTIVQRLLFAMTLTAAAQAFNGSVTFTEAIFINSLVSLVLGFMPVPGGIGVGEAALTAGLTAVGMPEGAALAAAVTHRMVTTYLPPIYGWYTTRWLTDNDYL